jgi:hypothetical protein
MNVFGRVFIISHPQYFTFLGKQEHNGIKDASCRNNGLKKINANVNPFKIFHFYGRVLSIDGSGAHPFIFLVLKCKYYQSNNYQIIN